PSKFFALCPPVIPEHIYASSFDEEHIVGGSVRKPGKDERNDWAQDHGRANCAIFKQIRFPELLVLDHVQRLFRAHDTDHRDAKEKQDCTGVRKANREAVLTAKGHWKCGNSDARSASQVKQQVLFHAKAAVQNKTDTYGE